MKDIFDDTMLDKVRKRLFNKPDAATADEWIKYETETPKKFPVLYFLLETMPIAISIWWHRNVKSTYRGLRAIVRMDRYIKLEFDTSVVPRKGRTKNWNDSITKYGARYNDSLKMLHACFQILVTTYENNDEEKIEYLKNCTDRYGDAWKEFDFLYKWWTIDRPMNRVIFPDMADYGLATNVWGVDKKGIKNETKPEWKVYLADEEDAINRMNENDLKDKEMLLRLIAYSDMLY